MYIYPFLSRGRGRARFDLGANLARPNEYRAHINEYKSETLLYSQGKPDRQYRCQHPALGNRYCTIYEYVNRAAYE